MWGQGFYKIVRLERKVADRTQKKKKTTAFWKNTQQTREEKEIQFYLQKHFCMFE